MELFNTSTPEKAFKTSVRPLGGLFVLQGVLMLHTFLTWPVEHLSKAPIPFVPDPFKNYFLIATALLILAIGIGLLFRSKGLWYVFIAYIVLSPIYMILGLAFDYFPVPGPKIFIVTAATIFSAIISGGLYIVTKPAFIKNS